jgi:hypothetical protein
VGKIPAVDVSNAFFLLPGCDQIGSFHDNYSFSLIGMGVRKGAAN